MALSQSELCTLKYHERLRDLAHCPLDCPLDQWVTIIGHFWQHSNSGADPVQAMLGGPGVYRVTVDEKGMWWCEEFALQKPTSLWGDVVAGATLFVGLLFAPIWLPVVLWHRRQVALLSRPPTPTAESLPLDPPI